MRAAPGVSTRQHRDHQRALGGRLRRRRAAEQGCCGALSLHAGRLDDARAFARRTIEVFERAGVERVAVNAAGCGSSMKEYGALLADDPAWADRARAFAARVRDVSEIVSELARRGRPGTRLRCGSRITTPATSRMRRASASRPAISCESIPGIELLPLVDQDICCEQRRHLQPGRAGHGAGAR
jgi:glycolate oxidase iron-sulfur subunit